MNRRFVLLLLSALVIMASSACRGPAGSGGWRWEKKAGSSLALIGPGGLLWQLHYAADGDHVYFHPLQTSDGVLLTWDRPPDHLWHHGLWFSWKYINKVNYWEIDPETGHPAGRTSWTNVRVSTTKDLEARIEMDLDYRPVGESAPVLTEKRTIAVSRPGGDGVYAIDWTGAFEAAADIVLDRTLPPWEPGGQFNGGYAGLSLRLAEGLEDREVMTSDGPAGTWSQDRYRGRHVALDYSGLIDGRPAGVAILDHTANPRTPTPWYVIRSAPMSWFNPAVLCYETLSLHPGDTFVLRYRVLVHPGRWDAERLQKEAARFSRDRR